MPILPRAFLDNLECRWTYRKLVSPYLDGELDPQTRLRFAGHAHRCRRCGEDLEAMRFASETVRALAVPHVSPSLSNVARRKETAPRAGFFHGPAPAGSMALFLLIGVLFVGPGLLRTTPDAAFEVVRLAGIPRVNSRQVDSTGSVKIGQAVETDHDSRAMLMLGKLGQVELEPDTRMKVVGTAGSGHRFQLSRGRLFASISAPPRLIVIETPSANAIDLGCAYSLDVDETGSTLLRVVSGWVSLEFEGREVLVPAGARCRAKPGVGPGTPYFEGASPEFVDALNRFDFEGGSSEVLEVVLREARLRDCLTLWHLLWRVRIVDRDRVFDRLESLVPLPSKAEKTDVLGLKRSIMNEWRDRLEYAAVGIDPDAAPRAVGSIHPVGALKHPRFAHASVLLADGRVLIAGGQDKPGKILTDSEIFDPEKRAFSDTGRLNVPRANHTATRLNDGKVLIAGGSDVVFFKGGLASAELFDPRTDTFTPVSPMTAARSAHRATLLPDGRVLVTGGLSQGRYLETAELYDPASGRFIPTGSRMVVPRADHAATLLADGRVLITGGCERTGNREVPTPTAEIYDPAADVFTPVYPMNVPRFKHSAVLLADGRVLVLGGSDWRYWNGQYASAEIFDPMSAKFVETGKMATARYKIRDAAVMLKNGRILVSGGGSRVEIYDPRSEIFGLVEGVMGAPRYYSTATLLRDGGVLIVGGYCRNEGDPENQTQADGGAWLFEPE